MDKVDNKLKKTKKRPQEEGMWRWQVKRSKQTEQNMYILENKEWTDCTFVLGDQIIQAHRLILAKASPVFAAMLITSPLASPGEIVINDQNPEAFSKLVRFIYTEELAEDISLKTMRDLITLADFYDVPSLVQVCAGSLSKKLSPCNACHVIDLAEQMRNEELKQKATEIIIKRTNEAMSNFNVSGGVSQSSLLAMTSQTKLNLNSEASLINACLQWAKHQARHLNLSLDTAGYRQALGPVISNLRFLSLTALEFVQGPAKSDVLTDQEKVALLTKIIDPTDKTPLQKEFSLNKEKRNVVAYNKCNTVKTI